MIPAIASNPKFYKIQISTGNILNVNNKLGSRSNEELLDALDGLKANTLQNETSNNTGNHALSKTWELNDSEGQVLRATNELNQKLTENERSEISIGAKLFLNKSCTDCIDQAVGALLKILKVQHVDNLVLAYHPKSVANAVPSAATGATIKWNSHNEQAVAELKQLWKTLEEHALQKKITQLGISDLDVETLEELYAVARVPPTIEQINLASCCVVPPPLKDFCTKHDVQLLTHSDPEILLPDEEFILPDYAVDWTLRYQVHLRCRGVLTAKGYILGASKRETSKE